MVAFLGSVAMWWIYFNIGAERGSREIAGSADPGRIARAVYTYFHIPIVAGIVVCAVADEITIAHPGGHLELPAALALLGGPALYLVGNVFFKRASAKYYPAVAPGRARIAGADRAVRAADDAAGARHRDHRGAHHRRRLGDALVRERRGKTCRRRALHMKSSFTSAGFAAALLMQPLPARSAAPAGVDRRAPRRRGSPALALKCVHQEYPNKIAHTLAGDADVRPPRELFPAFHGCYDWHSAVHGHWLLVRLARQFPDAAFAPAARAALARSLTRENIAGEVAYLQRAGRASFERPYGLAWLLQLAAELRSWKDPQAQEWARNLAPLETRSRRTHQALAAGSCTTRFASASTTRPRFHSA